jgi:signal transduction histidine kinase|nr:MAG: hybrid sensor histidine kinase/response regulator [Pseudomonadota bacterium]
MQGRTGEADGRVNILLVDDQPARLLSYRSILEELGQNLVCVHSGAEALSCLMHTDFALILLDVSMPGMDGFETAAMIHEHPRFESTPIIFVTGVHDTEFDRLKGYKLGAVDYVSIPVVPEILRGKVSVLIELHCKRRDLEAANRSLAEANRALAEANANLELEKARELEVLNRDLQASNRDLARSNQALQAQVAERNRAERALKEADRRKDEFLAILAHELRNPLAALSASARLLGMQPQKPEFAAMASSSIQRQVTHMARLLDDLLDVSRISHGVMQLQRDRVDLADVVRSAAEMVRPQLEAKQQVLNTLLPDAPAPVLADAVRMIQVLANLLSNSVKYSPEGGRIEMQLIVGEQEVSVAVRDQGAGIEPSRLEQVFDMFYQVSKAQGGLGIGLALVRGLVELHGGRVKALSGGVGQGSEFVLTLPRIQDDLALAAQPGDDGDDACAGPMRVLVADDNRDNALSWAILVEGMGHDVAVAYDGLSAVQTAALMRPQVLLLDIGMPHLDGYEVARRIRATDWGREAFLVAVTGWGQARDRAQAREAGFDEHYTKPLDPEQLEGLLRRASRKAREVRRGLAAARAG